MSPLPPNSVFTVFAFIGFLLAVLPLPWHMQSWNIGTCMYMLWTSLGCLIEFVNSIIWNSNVVNWAPVWCDISARYYIGSGVGIPASSLCIIRRLYYITTAQNITVRQETRKRQIIIDLSIGVGFPCVVMALEYIVQGRRFMITERIGCYHVVVNTAAAYFLIFMWPLVIGLVSLVYAVSTFRRAFQQKERLKIMLQTGFSISAGRYWRLMALCSSEIIFTVPLSLYVIIGNATYQQPSPYISWAWIHADFSQIFQYPTAVLSPGEIVEFEMSRSFYVLCAFVIFAFFGWAQEVRDFYCEKFWSVCRFLRCSKPIVESKRSTRAGNMTHPIHHSDQQMGADHLSMPVQARMRHDPLRSSLSAFEAPPCLESRSSSSRRSVDVSTKQIPRLSSLRDLSRHTQLSWADMPVTPEPALIAECRSQPSNQDVGQLV